MGSYDTIAKIRRLEKECAEFGFRITKPKHNSSQAILRHISSLDAIALVPKDQNSLPIYSRDAELFNGTLEELDIWLRGIEWARQYDTILKLSDDKKRKRKEQDELNKKLVQILKGENQKGKSK